LKLNATTNNTMFHLLPCTCHVDKVDLVATTCTVLRAPR